MNRRKFLCLVNSGMLSVLFNFSSCKMISRQKLKNWIWLNPGRRQTEEDYKKLFSKFKNAGIDAILPCVYNGRTASYQSEHLPVNRPWLETILPIAKSVGLEVHAWIWTMPCNIKAIHEEHPDWFVVNGRGESCLDKPAYVNYYRFLCPNREGAQKFLQQTVSELAHITELDGIHLDYIRFPDVILAEALQPKYHIVQDKEYPQYDYCYCEVCREKFSKQTGIDPLTLNDPGEHEQWRLFRYDSITDLVNDKLIPVAKEQEKIVSAAVFPNWEMVRQQWSHWKLDAALPMLYHNFYNQEINWIREETQKGVDSLSGSTKLYSGLFVPALEPEILRSAITASIEGGAKGISLFSARLMTDEHWKVFSEVVK